MYIYMYMYVNSFVHSFIIHQKGKGGTFDELIQCKINPGLVSLLYPGKAPVGNV